MSIRRHHDAESLRGLEIDDEFIIGRCLHRRVGRSYDMDLTVATHAMEREEIFVAASVHLQPSGLDRTFPSRDLVRDKLG